MAVILFNKKEECCGCGACKNACPVNAVSMIMDKCGFSYPQIDPSLCIECGLCKKVCGYQNVPLKSAQMACYAVAAKDEEILKKSASGGFFAVLAKKILANEGAVYGVCLSSESTHLTAKHIRIDSIEKLSALQGSKYIQSDVGLSYQEAKRDLQNGKTVLFSGTPCQIAGLNTYLGKKYDNLVTVEVICHGVPNAQMFEDFLKQLENKKKSKIVDFAFRTKEKGQGMNIGISYMDDCENLSRTVRDGHLYSYMHFFLKSYIYRSNCYSCPFATQERVADLTIGDFWGFHEEYPSLSADMPISNAKGVSCVLVNSKEGADAFSQCKSDLYVLETKFENIARHNAQLRMPSSDNQKRMVIMQLYSKNGYDAVEKYFIKTCRKQRVAHWAMSLIPKSVKRKLKRAIGIIKKAVV